MRLNFAFLIANNGNSMSTTEVSGAVEVHIDVATRVGDHGGPHL